MGKDDGWVDYDFGEGKIRFINIHWAKYLVENTVLNTVQATELVEAMRSTKKTTHDEFQELERCVMVGGYDHAMMYAAHSSPDFSE